MMIITNDLIILIIIYVLIFLLIIKLENMAQIDLNLGAAFDDPSADSIRAGGQTIQANFTDLYDTVIVAATDRITALEALNSNLEITKIISLGAWDMDVTAQQVVAWALPTGALLTSLEAIIRGDVTANTFVPITKSGDIYYFDGSFYVNRTGAGYFDNTDYDRVDRSRGYISVKYIVI